VGQEPHLHWLVNKEILDEYKTILTRRKVRANLIGALISLIRSAAEKVPPATRGDISLRSRQ